MCDKDLSGARAHTTTALHQVPHGLSSTRLSSDMSSYDSLRLWRLNSRITYGLTGVALHVNSSAFSLIRPLPARPLRFCLSNMHSGLVGELIPPLHGRLGTDHCRGHGPHIQYRHCSSKRHVEIKSHTLVLHQEKVPFWLDSCVQEGLLRVYRGSVPTP